MAGYMEIMPSSSFGICFIIASYNVSSCLERCVKSIQTQTLDNIQIIIVNDKSTDNTLEVAQKLCEEDSLERTICISHLENQGLAAVRNTGVEAATLSHIWHIDGDDYLPGENVALQIMNALQDQGLLAVKLPVFEETDDQPFLTDFYSKELSNKFFCEALNPVEVEKKFGHGGAFSVVYSKQFAHSLGIKNLEGVSIGEDQILLCQILDKLPCIGLVNIPMYVYDKTGPSMMRKVWPLSKYLEDRIYFHFIYRSLKTKDWKFKYTFEARFSYIFNIVRYRAEEHLDQASYNLICRCWAHDYFTFKPNQMLEFWKDQQRDIEIFLRETDDINYIQLFDQIFLSAEIVVHCGAHKTATTFIQSQLHEHRYDLALEGIIYIDNLLFRSYFTAGRKIDSMDDESIKRNLVICVLPMLFRMPKKIIISEENLIQHNKKTGFFACTSKLHDDRYKRLFRILGLLRNCQTKIYYSIRNYNDYLASMYCENMKWKEFATFEDYTDKLFEDLGQISWDYIVNDLSWSKDHFGVYQLNIIRFEDFQDDPSRLLKELIGVDLPEKTSTAIQDVFYRRSPSQEAVEKALKLRQVLGDKSAQSFYKKLVAMNFGGKKFKPNIDPKLFAALNNKYEQDCQSLVSCCLASDAKLDSVKPTLNTQFSDLTRLASPYASALTSLIDNQPEDLDLSLDAWRNNFISSFRLKNIEARDDFNVVLKPLRASEIPEISAMLRVKNEAKNIENVINYCLLMFDEVVVVDNMSTDETVSIVESFIEQNPKGLGERVKLYRYPFEVRRCGQENFDCPENSIHSLAYFYNYALSKCSCSYVFKWDGDMILNQSMINDFLEFKKAYLHTVVSMRYKNRIAHGAPKGITIYKGFDKRYYCQPDTFEQEVRLFPNTSANIFVKSILWEQLYTPYPVEVVNSQKLVFIEYKDVSQDEFSHWKIGDLGMGMRKRNELKCFNLVAELTRNGSPSPAELRNAGLREVEDLDSLELAI